MQEAEKLAESPVGDAPSEPAGEKKPKYSRRLKNLQRIERGVTKANRRLARAVVVGLKTWEKRRKKSALARKDGAIRDAFGNVMFAASEMVREASWAGVDFAKEVKSRIRRKDLRRILFPFSR